MGLYIGDEQTIPRKYTEKYINLRGQKRGVAPEVLDRKNPLTPICSKCLYFRNNRCGKDWKISVTAYQEYRCFFYKYEFIKEDEYTS